MGRPLIAVFHKLFFLPNFKNNPSIKLRAFKFLKLK